MNFFYIEENNGFKVTFKYDKQNESSVTTPKNEVLTSKPINKGVESNQILDLIKKNSNITKEYIALTLGISVNAVKYHLKHTF